MIKILWESDYKTMKNYIDELEKTEEILEKEVAGQRHQLNLKERTIQRMQQDYNGLEKLKNKQIEELAKQIDVNKNHIDELEENLVKVIKDRDNFKASNIELKARAGGLTAGSNKKEKENQDLKQQIDELKKKVEIQAETIRKLSKNQKHTSHEYAHDGQPKHLKNAKQRLKK